MQFCEFARARLLISITGHTGIHLDSYPLWRMFRSFIRLVSETVLRGTKMSLQMRISDTVSKLGFRRSASSFHRGVMLI